MEEEAWGQIPWSGKCWDLGQGGKTLGLVFPVSSKLLGNILESLQGDADPRGGRAPRAVLPIAAELQGYLSSARLWILKPWFGEAW